ncbi:CHRD domain-containing protein [soil metagenome]
MRGIITMAAAGVLVLGCAEQPTQPQSFSLPVFSHGAAVSPNASGGNFGAPLNAAEEVMPAGVVNDSRARGNALLQLSGDGQSISFQLSVANIENVIMAHIHLGAFGTNGPVIVWLYPSVDARAPLPSGGGRIQGVIATGTFTAADLVGPLQGDDLATLIDVLKNGGAYVNVHTNDGVAPTNTGPGDFPGGEVRGQIRHHGH